MTNLEQEYNNYFDQNFKNPANFKIDNKIKIILKLVGQHKRVLDVGCSTGYLAYFLQKNNNLVSGVDFLSSAVAIAKQNNIEACVCNLENEKLPYPDSTFETVVFSETIEHLIDPIITLKEIWRVLKPKGTLIVSTPNIAYLQYRFELMFGRLPDFCEFRYKYFERHYNFQHKSLFTHRILEKTLYETGFKVMTWHSHSSYKNRLEKIFTFMEYLWPRLFRKNIIAVAQKYEAK